jgi:hypothetical protein
MPSNALLLGNGDLGAALGGDATSARFHLGLNQFWAVQQYTYPQATEPPYPRVEGVGAITISTNSVDKTVYFAELNTAEATILTNFSCSSHIGHLTSKSFISDSNVMLTTLTYATTNFTDAMDVTVTASTIAGNPKAPTSAGVGSNSDKSRHGDRDSHHDYHTNAPEVVWSTREAVLRNSSPYPVIAAVAVKILGVSSSNSTVTSTDGVSNSNVTFKILSGESVTVLTMVLTNQDLGSDDADPGG